MKVPPHNPSQRTDREWYLPHQAVVNPHKPGKVRRVLNGASKFQGHSLNNSLLTGPDLLQSLLHVLFRFREHSYAVSADIEAMFMQVGVLPEDQRSLRFLWREDRRGRSAVGGPENVGNFCSLGPDDLRM